MSEDRQPVYNPYRIRLMRGDKLTEDEMRLAMGNDGLGGGYIEDDDQCKGITREEFDDICQRLGQVEKDIFNVKEMLEQFQTFSKQEIRNATKESETCFAKVKELLKEQAEEESEFRNESH